MKAVARSLASAVIATAIVAPVAARAQAVEAWRSMPLAASTAAPAGYADYCLRHARDCTTNPAQADGAELSKVKQWAAASLWSTVFAAHDGAPGSTTGGALGSGRLPEVPVAITSGPSSGLDMAELRRINLQINRSIRSATDAALYGRHDFWAGPEENGAKGDCEDYVLAKRAALIAAGAPASTLSIALVRTFRGELHAVLLVATTQGEVVLDNLSANVAPWTKAPYSWIERQRPGAPRDWVSIAAD